MSTGVSIGAGNVTELVDAAISKIDPWHTWSELQQPGNHGTIMAFTMAASLITCFAGHRILKIWLFLAGFIGFALAFYTFSPLFLKFKFCCLPGSELERLGLSAAVGVLGGILALAILRLGIFLTGCCMGFIASMLLMMTPLGSSEFMHNPVAFGVFYIGIALLGGFIALYAQSTLIMLTTSTGGALVFFLAVDSFLDVHFHVIVTEVTDHALRAIYGEPFEPIRMDTMGYVLVGMWLVLSLCGFLSQSRTGGKSVAQVAQGKEVIVIMNGGRQGAERSMRLPIGSASSSSSSWLGGWFGGKGSESSTVYADLDGGYDGGYDAGPERSALAHLHRSMADKYRYKMERYKLQAQLLKDKLLRKKKAGESKRADILSTDGSSSSSDDLEA